MMNITNGKENIMHVISVGLEYKNRIEVWKIWFCNKWVKKVSTLISFFNVWRSLVYLTYEQVENAERRYGHVSVVNNVSIKYLEVWFVMYLILIVMGSAVDWTVINQQFCISWIITLFLFGEARWLCDPSLVSWAW
jgi:hypothetical protein